MSRELTAVLGCIQSEVSYADPAGRPQVHESCLTERVVLPQPREGANNVAVTCKHCQQGVRIQVRSHRIVWRKRLASQLALAVSVCLWVAATALALLYVLDPSPSAPGREILVGGILVAVGAVLWVSVDRQAAFAGDVVAGCTIERTPIEKAWARHVSPGVMQALPRHVLLDPGQELAAAGLGAELARTISSAWHKPGVTPKTAPPAPEKLPAGPASRAA